MSPPPSIPGPRGPVDTVRIVRGLTSDPCPTLDACARRYGPTFQVGAGPLRMVVVGDPSQLGELLSAPVDAFRWGHWANVLGFVVGRTSLIVSDGEDHHHRRGRVLPGFAKRRLDQWIPMIVAETDRTIEELAGHPGATIDAYPFGKRLVLRIVVNAFFGSGLADRVDEIDRNFEELQGYMEQSGARQLPHRIPGTRRARARAAHQRMDALIDGEMARRRTSRGPEAGDVLDALLDEDDEPLTDEEVRDQVNTLIGAGYHTTAASLAWTLDRALASPGVWAKLRDEADTVFGHGADPPDLQRLVYARAVVHEALRLHPAGVFAPRQAVRDVSIGPFTIRRGTMVLWSPYLSGRDPDIWARPLEFHPERHLDADPATIALQQSAWVPFGRGPRRCIGFALAQMELTLIVARLAQSLDLTLERTDLPRPYGVVVNRPEGGVPVSARPRPTPAEVR